MRKIFVMGLDPFSRPACPEAGVKLPIRERTRSTGLGARGDCSHAIAVAGTKRQERLPDRFRDDEARLSFEFHPNGEKAA